MTLKLENVISSPSSYKMLLPGGQISSKHKESLYLHKPIRVASFRLITQVHKNTVNSRPIAQYSHNVTLQHQLVLVDSFRGGLKKYHFHTAENSIYLAKSSIVIRKRIFLHQVRDRSRRRSVFHQMNIYIYVVVKRK